MARQNTGMAPSVFAVLTLLILDAVAMAQIRYGGSGWAQIYHLDYAHHFSQRTFHRSVQAKVFNLPGETTESYGGWINQTGTQVRTGGVEFNFDSSFYFDQAPSKEGQTTSPTLDKGLPSFGWNLDSALIQNKFPEFQHAFAPNEAGEQISPIPQVFGVCLDHGDTLITTLSPNWQERVDESMWEAVRDMPKSIKDALIEEGERRSGKAFMVPTEPRLIWYTEVPEFYSKKGTATKITGPAGPKLIRITGNNPSEIYGTLDAGDEDIILINPQGVFVGPGSRIK